MKTKIVYVIVSSSSDIYLEQAWASVWSLKYYNPDAYVIFVMDEDTLSGIKDNKNRVGILELVDEPICLPFDAEISGKERSRIIKTTLRKIVKGDFLFIDSDTLITGTLQEVDSLKCHIGMTYDLHCKLSDFPFKDLIIKEQKRLYGEKIRENTEQFNSGVIYAKDDPIAYDFFTKWHDNWNKVKLMTDYRDQPSLLKTCEMYPNIVEPLSGIYNCQIAITIAYLYNAKILHYFNNIWKRVYITPFMEKTIYLRIKEYGGLSEDTKKIILNCKSEFYTPTMPITVDDVQFGRSELYKYLLSLFSSHKKTFNFFDGFFKIKKRAIKLIKLLCYYGKNRIK